VSPSDRRVLPRFLVRNLAIVSHISVDDYGDDYG
jgi:hypothetical protein